MMGSQPKSSIPPALKPVLELSAFVLICMVFWNDRKEAILREREERDMFRAVLIRQQEQLDRLTVAVERLDSRIAPRREE